MADVDCADMWKEQTMFADYIMPIIYALTCASMFPPVYVYVKAYITAQIKSPKNLLYATLSLCSLYWTRMLLACIMYGGFCYSPASFRTIYQLIILCYIWERVLLLSIFFIKSLVIFKNTPVQLTKLSIRLFWALSAAVAMIGSVGNLLTFGSTKTQDFGLKFSLFSMVLYVIGVIWLNALFISKLRAVVKLSDDAILTKTIIKTTVLCFISTPQIFLFLAGWYAEMSGAVDSPYAKFVNLLVGIVDGYCNYAAVLLSYKYFETQYFLICGCCHTQCRKVCGDNASTKTVANDQELQSTSSMEKSQTNQACQTADI